MARQDEIRIGDAERDAVMVALHDHYAEGRLDRGELDERLDAVLSAKTRGDLRTLVKDLPSPTGLPEQEKTPALGAPLMLGGPGHPAWQHHRHMARHHHGPRFPAFPLLLAVFLVLTFTIGPGTGFLAVLQIALVIWIIRAITRPLRTRHSPHP
ncbi:DUF1707 SHOCT-like domain-containing protein [Actinomadura bangladeshensis]|uniref:DUF1707 domain-containing protein n=1 Tax=Actinomadura bangladeshensis TaxID=453573 RepID=A0A6L9QC86_9ACTN|nr:DUF1707 domain-containing protein [Actinomadura bangladeshensis]NEA21834.1 DUF1707 domain-containing protein [Actinomadura bangladeshensis]